MGLDCGDFKPKKKHLDFVLYGWKNKNKKLGTSCPPGQISRSKMAQWKICKFKFLVGDNKLPYERAIWPISEKYFWHFILKRVPAVKQILDWKGEKRKLIWPLILKLFDDIVPLNQGKVLCSGLFISPKLVLPKSIPVATAKTNRMLYLHLNLGKMDNQVILK